MKYEFNGGYSKKEYLRGMIALSFKNTRGPVIRVALLLVSIGLYTAFAFMLFQQPEKSTHDTARLVRYLIGAAILIYAYLRPLFNAIKMVNKIYKPITHNGYVSHQGIVYVFPHGEYLTPWESVSHVRSTKDFVALLTDKGTYCFLPKHLFKSEKDWSEIQRLTSYKVIEPI